MIFKSCIATMNRSAGFQTRRSPGVVRVPKWKPATKYRGSCRGQATAALTSLGPLAHNLFRVRIRPEDFHKIAMRAQILDRPGHFFVMGVAIAIYEEEIFPGFAFTGTGFNLGQIDFGPAERRERLVQRADFICDANHQARAVLAGRRAALAA